MLVLLYLGVMTIYLFTARKTEDGREHQNMLLLGPIKTVVAALRSRGKKNLNLRFWPIFVEEHQINGWQS